MIAEPYAFRGEIDNAFEWLDYAYDNGHAFLRMAPLEPLLAKLHDDPRWEPFVDKIGLPE